MVGNTIICLLQPMQIMSGPHISGLSDSEALFVRPLLYFDLPLYCRPGLSSRFPPTYCGLPGPDRCQLHFQSLKAIRFIGD